MPASGRAGVAVGPWASAVAVGVAVGVVWPVPVGVAVFVGVALGVPVGVAVAVGEGDAFAVAVAVGEADGVCDGLVIVKEKSSQDCGASALGRSGAVGATWVSRNW